MKRHTDDIPSDEIKGMRDVLRDLINDSSLEYIIKLAIDVEMEESTKLFNEHKERQRIADLYSYRIQNP